MSERHRGCVIWLTGLPASGKSTLARELEAQLRLRGYSPYVLDGDVLRTGLNSGLGFGPGDRHENIRRAGEVGALFCDAGLICIAAFISPYAADRAAARAAVGPGRFHEVYVAADVACCEARDPKGNYRRARLGELKDFTGVDAPYEIPDKPELVIDTSRSSVAECVQQLMSYVESRCPQNPSIAHSFPR